MVVELFVTVTGRLSGGGGNSTRTPTGVLPGRDNSATPGVCYTFRTVGTTINSDVGKIEKLLLRHARDAFVGADKVAAEWRDLNYHSAPDFERAVGEYDRLQTVFQDLGAEIVWFPACSPAAPDAPAVATQPAGSGENLRLDSIYVRDAAILTDNGAVLCSMGKASRRHEPVAVRPVLEQAGIAVLGEIGGAGRLEGGDVCWMGPRTLAVGEGYRTNAEGIEQLEHLLGDQLDELVVVPLPHWHGPADVFHLMSVLSPVAHGVVLVYSPLLPVRFRRWMSDREIRFIEVPDEEFVTMACNVLALAPGRVLMLDGNPTTQQRLAEAGIETLTYAGDEISRKGEGGPTCLTRPLVRQE